MRKVFVNNVNPDPFFFCFGIFGPGKKGGGGGGAHVFPNVPAAAKFRLVHKQWDAVRQFGRVTNF